ncbi:MAG: glycosyltransferase [Lachnospiraceae bacterium]|nr:glycosyltransferase [Lachnospiraceae bacterium]
MFGNIKRTINYYKKNGLKDTYYAVLERMWEKRHNKYEFVPPMEEDLEKQRGKKYAKSLKISVVVPAYETPEVFLQDLILSVVEQTYPQYELVIADASQSGKVRAVVRSFQEQYDGIVYLPLAENAGISGNTNAAIEAATGDYIALLDHDDMITADALYLIREEIDKATESVGAPVLVYTDEDKMDRYREHYFEPYRKRDFDPELLYTNNYICHFSAFRADVLKELKLRAEFDGAQDYDLILRCAHWCREHYSEKSWMKYIRHVPQIVYHWRTHPASTAGDTTAKQYAYEAGLRASQEALRAEGIDAIVNHMKHLGFYRADYPEDIFSVRPDLGAVGGPIYRHDEVVSGLMKADGEVVFKELPKGFSGTVHIAALQQSAEAIDLRNMRIREDLIPLFEKTTGLKWPLEKEIDAEQAKSKSLRFCAKLREQGIGILYDPQMEKTL